MSGHDLDPQQLLAQGLWLRRLARNLVGEAAADDVMQETYAAALASPPRSGQPLRPWMAAVLRNFARMMFRGDSRRRAREARVGEVSATSLPTPEDLLASHQAQRLVAEAVEALEEPFRSTVLLCYVEGLSPSEVARKQGILAGTVRWRLSRALDLIRARLEERDGGRRGLALLLTPLTGRGTGAEAARPKGAMMMLLKIAGGVVLLGLVVGLWQTRRPLPVASAGAQSPSARTAVPPVPSPLPRLRPALAAVEPAGSIEGVVRDEAGRPIRGATVAAFDQVSLADIGTGRHALGPAALASTGAGGRYRFDRLAPRTYGVTATAAGFVPGHRGAIVVPSAERARADLVLARGAVTLRGRVLDVGGGPVAAARVMAIDFAGPAPDTTKIFVALSDQRGTYQLPLGRRVRYGFAADADGYAQARLPVETLDEDRVRDITLKPMAQVSGRVLDAATAAPVAGAMVRLARQDGTDIPFVLSVLTDARGEFAMRGVAPSSYRLWARKGRVAGRHAAPVTVGEADVVSGLVLTLERRPVIDGRVLSADGRPVPGAQLWFTREEGTVAQEPQASTDGEGRYRIEGVLPGSYVLKTSAPGHCEERRDVAVGSADLPGVDFHLSPEARLRGRVFTADGNPAAGVRVLVLPARRPRDGEPLFLTTRTSSDGAFHLEGLRAAPVRVAAEDAHLGVARGTTVWTLVAGETRELTLRMEPGASVWGRVRRADGNPASGVVVTAFQGPTGVPAMTRSARTGGDGTFVLRALVGHGEIRLLATTEEPIGEPRSLPAGAAAATLTLPSGQDARDVELILP